MANKITITNIIPTENLVTQSSRYAQSTVLYYGDQNKMTFSTYKRNITEPSPRDRYTVISSRYEFRPDLLSSDVYGTPDFWWKLLESNYIKDIFDFKTGMTIRVPDVSNIF